MICLSSDFFECNIYDAIYMKLGYFKLNGLCSKFTVCAENVTIYVTCTIDFLVQAINLEHSQINIILVSCRIVKENSQRVLSLLIH